MDNNKIAMFLTNLREEKHLTQEQLGKEIFIGREGISKWERGVSIPSTEMLVKLSEFYNISVNEILCGERKNEKNKKKIDRISLDILKDRNKKVKTLKIVISIFLSIIFVLLFAFFLVNYNSIKVYNVGFESDKYKLDEGILVLSREEFYLNLGDINSENQINKINLYVLKDEKKYNLISVNDKTLYYVNKFGNDQDFGYDDCKFIINNMYLDIYEQENFSTIKLDSFLIYNNIKLFYNNSNVSIFDNNSNNNESKIPEFVKKNFVLNEDYIYEYIDKNYELKYDNTSNNLTIFNMDMFIIYEYYINYNTINIVANNNNYEYKLGEVCDNKLCKSKDFDYVFKNYITKFVL